MSGPAKFGIVKQVVSGDTIVVRGQPKGGPPPELTLILSSITAPKLAKRAIGLSAEESKDEPYAWEAREFLRKKLIGESISFINEKPANAPREYSIVYLNKDKANEENVNETMVKEGYVTVRAQGSPLKELEEQAKNAGKGKYSKTTKDEDHVRDVKWNMTPEQLQALVDRYQGKPVKAVVEHVRDGSVIRCFIQDDKTFYHLTLMITGIKCPGYKLEGGRPNQAEPFTEEAKFYVESRLLNRDVEITLDAVNGNSVVGSVLHPKGNIAELLLQAGYAKCFDWTMKFVKNPETLRKCERVAKEARLKLWKDWQPAPSQLSGDKEFQATVVEVGNGDALTVKLPDGSVQKVFLSSIRPPRLAGNEENKDGPPPPRSKASRPLYDIPWMFEAREFLRKKLIGKKVNVIKDYVQPANEKLKEKVCCTVTVGGVNVAEAMVLKGLATVVKHRSDDENRSLHYDNLTSAELKAVKSQKGLHSKKDIPVHRINDYSSDSTKAKNIFPHLKRSSARTEALVEFVFSGSRLRLFIAKDSCLITLLLAGISCPRAPRPSQAGPIEGEPYGEEALQLTKEKCFQREVEISLESVDKAGNFIGWLWVDNVNLSVALVQEGLSKVHEFSAERSEHYRALMDAQHSAKTQKINIWKNYVEEEEKEKHKDEEETVTERKVNYQKVVVIEVTNELRIFTQQEDQCSKLESMLSKMRSELANVTIGAYTPKRGELCAAKFELDGQWYRAKIEKITGSLVKVFYVDYGNRDEIPSTSCAALPSGFSSDPPYATEYSLAFVKFGGDAEDQDLAVNVLRDDLLNCSVLLNVEYRKEGFPYVTLCSAEDNEKTDIVKKIVEEGYLLIDKRNDKRLLNVMEEYKKAQENALKNRKVLWRYGDITEDDDKEFGLGR